MLSNDTDPDIEDTLTVTGYDPSTPQGAIVQITTDGNLSYHPTSQVLQALAAGQTAADAFTYSIGDGRGGTSTATVSVTVQGANDGPTAGNDSLVGYSSTTLTANLLVSDHDVDAGDVIGVTQFDVTSALGATLSVSTNGLLTYDSSTSSVLQGLPVLGSAIDSFHYVISDAGGLTAEGVVTIHVTRPSNLPPVLAAIGNRLIAEGGSLTFTASAVDPDGAANDLRFSLDPGTPPGATIDAVAGYLNWNPAVGIHGGL